MKRILELCCCCICLWTAGIEKLVNVLARSDDSMCQDVALSILGNCCMHEKCILRVNMLTIVQLIKSMYV